MSLSHQSNGRFNVSFVTSRHTHQDGRVLDVRSGRRTARLQRPRARRRSNGLPVTYTFLNSRPTSLTQFVSPNCRWISSIPTSRCSCRISGGMNRVTITAGLRYDWLRESVAASSVPDGALVPAAVVPGHQERAELEGPQPETRRRVGSAGDGEDRDQVRHQPLRGVGHDRHRTTCSIPFGPGNSTRSARRERGATRTGTSCRTATSGSRRRTASAAQCSTRTSARTSRLPAGFRLGDGLGQASLQLADVDQCRPGDSALPRCQRRVLPHLVRQLHGGRQSARDAGGLQPVLRHRADGLALAAERPAAVRAL